MQEIKIGHIYRRFKGKTYIVLDIVNDCETNNLETPDKIVVYQALYGDHLKWARPLASFASEVDHAKYPDVAQHWRFEEIMI